MIKLKIIVIGGNTIESIAQKYKVHEANDDAEGRLRTDSHHSSGHLFLRMARAHLIAGRQSLWLPHGMGVC